MHLGSKGPDTFRNLISQIPDLQIRDPKQTQGYPVGPFSNFNPETVEAALIEESLFGAQVIIRCRLATCLALAPYFIETASKTKEPVLCLLLTL